MESVVAERILALEGTYNLRDLGGYATEDGRTTRWRTVFRSDSLHRLSVPAQAELLGLGLRTVVDLRYESELTEFPNVFASSGAVQYVNLPLLPTRASAPTLVDLYRTIIDDCGARLARVFTTLAEPTAMPALVHCTAGKDRTGVVVALLLRLAGVAIEAVALDYALTSTQIAGEFTAQHRREVEARGIEWASYESVMACEPEFILDLLAYVDAAYDGLEPYLHQIGLSADQLDALRTALVE